jgi:hypothetical protein
MASNPQGGDESVSERFVAAARSLETIGNPMSMRKGGAGGITYSVATLVNNHSQYDAMLATFRQRGFDASTSEFLHIDNTGSEQTDAYVGLNLLLSRAQGKYVILCHQDVRLLDDGRQELDAALDDLEQRDENWALAGNAGGAAPGRLVLRISDPHGEDTRVGNLPERVATLDENFIIVKRTARLGFSRDLSGFHFYGADLCLVADILGYSAYVIDFHLRHLSSGTKSAEFFAAEAAFRSKWSHALRSRWMQTTCALVPLSGGRLGRLIGGATAAPIAKITRRLPAGWR